MSFSQTPPSPAPGDTLEAGTQAEPRAEAGGPLLPKPQLQHKFPSSPGVRQRLRRKASGRVRKARGQNGAGSEPKTQKEAGPRAEPGLEFESLAESKTSFNNFLNLEWSKDLLEQKQKESTGEEVERRPCDKNGEKLGSLAGSSKSSGEQNGREESEDTLSSPNVSVTDRKALSKGDYCTFCTVSKTSDQEKRFQSSGPWNAHKFVWDPSLPPVGPFVDTCWVPRSLHWEKLMKRYPSRGLPSLVLTSPILNIQRFWDQHLTTRNRFFQGPSNIYQNMNLNRHLALLMGSKKLQQLLKAQEELEKRVQNELAIKAQVEQEMIQLNGELMKTRALRRQLIDDHCHMQAELQPFLGDSSVLMGYVPDPNKKNQVAPIKVWDQQTRQMELIQWQMQELVSRYESQTSSLQEELLRQEEIQAQLKKKIKALNSKREVQISQEEQIKSLQMDKPRVQKEAEEHLRSAQSNLIKEWRAMKHQLSEVELLLGKCMLGKHNQVLEHAAGKSIVKFTWKLQNENEQLHKETLRLIQEAQQLEAQRARLRKQKQQLQLEQCCLESIKEGRQHKLKIIPPCQKIKSGSKSTLAPLPGTKPRVN